jgi:hypothetical protein
MTTSKQLSDIRSTATGLRSALLHTQSCAPFPTTESEASDTERADMLVTLSKLAATLVGVLADGGANLDAQEITTTLERFRAQLEGENA